LFSCFNNYFLDSLAITTTSRITTATPITAPSHIPPPDHPLIHPLVWFIIKTFRCSATNSPLGGSERERKTVLSLGMLTVHQFIHPIALAIVVAMQTDLVITCHQSIVREFRRLLDGLARKIDEDFAFAPTHTLNPLR
jgi:hypothetical protein